MRIDLTGQRFGRLVVRCFDRKDKHGSKWICDCDCGTRDISIFSHALRSGVTLSCRCLNKESVRRATYRGIGELSGSYWNSIKKRAKDRKIRFTLSIQKAWDLFVKQNGKCALSGVDIFLLRDIRSSPILQTASLDRIDSNKGYVKGNVQWVHKDVNRMKSSFSEETFIKWCRLILSKKDNNEC